MWNDSSSMSPPMNLDTDAPEFTAALLEQARRLPMEKNPFIHSVCTGAYSRDALAIYGVRMFHLADSFPDFLYSLLAKCTAPQLRDHIKENIREEEGWVPDPGGAGWRKDPERKHSALIMKFIRAMGPEARPYTTGTETWAHKALHEGRLLAVSAYLMVGLEANVPRTFRLLIPAFRERYGFSNEELVFFIDHLTADEQHGEDGARILSELASTRQERLELLDGVNKGATAWWWFHRACHNAIGALDDET